MTSQVFQLIEFFKLTHFDRHFNTITKLDERFYRNENNTVLLRVDYCVKKGVINYHLIFKGGVSNDK